MPAVKKPPTLVLMQLSGFQLLQKTVIFYRQQMVLLCPFFFSDEMIFKALWEIWHSDNGKYSLRIWTWVSDLKALGKWAVIAIISHVECKFGHIFYCFLYFSNSALLTGHALFFDSLKRPVS